MPTGSDGRQFDRAAGRPAQWFLYLCRMVEGYAQQGPRGEQYQRSRVRASIVRDYLVGAFHLDPRATGAMPLSADSTDSPGKARWDGVALAVILPKDTLRRAVADDRKQ